MTPLTSVISAIHQGQLNARQRECLIGLLLRLAACSAGMASCPEMTTVGNAYAELLSAGSTDQHQ